MMNRHLLKELIKHHKVKELDVANATGIPLPTLYRLLNGATIDPKLSTIVPLAQYFNISIGQLIGQEPLCMDKAGKEFITFPKIPIISWQQAIQGKHVLLSLDHTSWSNWTIATVPATKEAYALELSPELNQARCVLIVEPDRSIKNNDYVIIHRKESENAILKQVYDTGDEIWLLDPARKIAEVKLDEAYIVCGVVSSCTIEGGGFFIP
jgi:transcriptional regulator with XRE-family HTH domain